MCLKIIAIDFDGTLCENEWPEIGDPNIELITYLKEEQKVGSKLILWTCRVGEMLKNAVEWCSKQGLIFDAINENLPEIVKSFGTDTRKIFANLYIDDHNICYMTNECFILDVNVIKKMEDLLDLQSKIKNKIPQSIYLIEEMSELTKELIKEQRFKGDFKHIEEEIADVLGVLLTYSLSIGVKFENIRNIIIQKLERGIQRLNNDEQ